MLLQDPSCRLAAHFYSLLSPNQKETLFTQKRVSFAVQDLAPPLQAPIRELVARRVAREEKYPNLPVDLERNLLRLQVIRCGGFLSVGMNLGNANTITALTRDENDQPGFGSTGWTVALLPINRLWLLPPHGNPYLPSPEDPQTVANFAQAVSQVPSTGEWIDRLEALADRTGNAVLADYYRVSSPNFPSLAPASESNTDPGVEQLDRFCSRERHLWWTRGDSLLLRNRDYYIHATYELPDSWVLRVAEGVASHRGLVTVGDVGAAEVLTAAQLDGLWSLGLNTFIQESKDSEASRELLSLVAGLQRFRDTPVPVTDPQKSGGELTLRLTDLALPQQQSVVQLGQKLGWILAPSDLRQFRLRISALPRRVHEKVEYASIYLRCEFGKAHHWSFVVYLPLGLSEDRRKLTSVRKVQ
jgi:hypothetical protein